MAGPHMTSLSLLYRAVCFRLVQVWFKSLMAVCALQFKLKVYQRLQTCEGYTRMELFRNDFTISLSLMR